MIDHVSIAVQDLAASAAFYDRVLAPLGYTRIAEHEHRIGFGKTYPELWLNHRDRPERAAEDTGYHICLRARDRDTVEAFHQAALAGGGRCDGPPGERQATVTTYFGAFIRDLEGNKIEAVTFPRT